MVDVGAYVGYYALLASQAAPTAVIDAFEPLAAAADLFTATARSSRRPGRTTTCRTSPLASPPPTGRPDNAAVTASVYRPPMAPVRVPGTS